MEKILYFVLSAVLENCSLFQNQQKYMILQLPIHLFHSASAADIYLMILHESGKPLPIPLTYLMYSCSNIAYWNTYYYVTNHVLFISPLYYSWEWYSIWESNMRSSKRSILNLVKLIPKIRSWFIRYPRDKDKIQTKYLPIWSPLFMAWIITWSEKWNLEPRPYNIEAHKI